VTEAREAERDEYVLNSNGHLITAIYYHSDKTSQIPLPPMMQIPIGSTVRVTGICGQLSSNPFNGTVPFDILLRSFDDIAVIARPSLLNIRNLIILVGLLLMIVIVVGIRGWAIERRVHSQTAKLATLERRRGRIFEDINSSRPLAEILEEITELVSFQLNDAPCCCEITDGAQLGSCPPEAAKLRIVKEEIPARSGPPLGVFSAAFDLLSKPSATETEALSMAAGLATLAIETRRLYSDLLHRSEFDLLTDIHNRFSLEKLLDAQIDQARLDATIFGLIYIDLDNFKQVNDSYGHQVGDQYLQQAALRLKRQLRPHDKLARLGGDEFAALVSLVRSRAEVEEIAQRLEHCFNEPFALEGLELIGSASVGIALYPQDGATKDDLLNVADAAMYVAKNARRQIEKSQSQSPRS
jgi:diguanylate cyclase (GGDEF)-like protein